MIFFQVRKMLIKRLVRMKKAAECWFDLSNDLNVCSNGEPGSRMMLLATEGGFKS